MNTIKKTVSVLLAVMMIFSMLTIVSVSAAETSTITVESNLCDAVQYSYDEDASQVTVTYNFQSDLMLLNAQGTLNYDSTVLQLASTNKPTTMVPGFSGAVVNKGLKNMVKFNATSLDLYDFTAGGVFFTATFDIIGSGDTTVDLDVEIITASEAKNYDDIVAGAEDVDLVYFDEVNADAFTFSAKADITSSAVTPAVKVTGDINVDLTTEDGNVYTGSADLEAGTYKFNVENNGTTHGMNYTYTDTAVIDYSAGYKAQTTLKASGGRYTFSFNATAKKLTITYKPFDEIVELFGDINLELVNPSKTGTVYTGSVRLDAGTYNFNINEFGKTFGNGSTFNNTIYNIPFNYTAAATFYADGGIYSVRYDTSNNQLKVLPAPAGLGDVSIFGDISLPLATQGNGIYSAQTILDAGTYEIKVDAFGKFYGNGSPFTDTINVEFSTSYKAAAPFTVSKKMKFTFIFDTNTNKVKVFNAPIDATKVKVAFDDIDELELTKGADGVTYTATTTLAAGTYTFRMDEFGTPMGGKYSFTDSYSMTYSAEYSSVTTMTATGGTYTFSFNTTTNKLTVKKA